MSAEPDREPGPEIELTQTAAQSEGAAGPWRITWRIENRGTDALDILSAHLPHGQFKSEELRFATALALAPGERKMFQVFARCDEPAGLVTENAFVIFHVKCSDEPWRIFVRIRVTMNVDGKPETETQSITTQRVGFSGIDS